MSSLWITLVINYVKKIIEWLYQAGLGYKWSLLSCVWTVWVYVKNVKRSVWGEWANSSMISCPWGFQKMVFGKFTLTKGDWLIKAEVQECISLVFWPLNTQQGVQYLQIASIISSMRLIHLHSWVQKSCMTSSWLQPGMHGFK